MEYLTVDGENEAVFEIRRSVFICQAKGVESFDEGMEFVKSVAKRYSDATHNCYAINCTDAKKFSDDGEPQGTAGQPIMQTIIKKGLTNVAAVVTRYFGGIKLGAGGLVTSYTKAVADALETAKIVWVIKSSVGRAVVDYAEYREVNELIKGMGKIISAEFNEGAEIEFAVPSEYQEKLVGEISALTGGKVRPEFTEIKYIKYN